MVEWTQMEKVVAGSDALSKGESSQTKMIDK